MYYKHFRPNRHFLPGKIVIYRYSVVEKIFLGKLATVASKDDFFILCVIITKYLFLGRILPKIRNDQL